MKKMLSCVLAGLLAAQGFGGSVFAGAAGQIKVGSAEVDPGASFELPVEITENPGITALSLELTYDASKLEFVGAADGKILGTSTFLGGKDLTLIPYTMNWDDLTDTDNTGTGNVAVLSFKAKEDASGSTEVKVAVNQKSTFNVDLDEVAFETASGTVTIKGETPAVVTTAPVATTAKPVVTTAKPVVTTAKPVVTTAKPVVTTAKPVVTTAKPVVTTAKPVVTTAKPVATTAKPVETTAKPVETTAKVTTRIAATTSPVSTTGAAPVTTAPAETAVPIVTTVYMDNGMPKVEIVSPYIAPDSVEAHTGEKVKVPVRIQNNP
ncbi:MAG: hypothetical protein J5722_07400, partial [Oscillospiraceae bacterium]|nr:hypothetical protein [Oscillospiraceae bacterium]